MIFQKLLFVNEEIWVSKKYTSQKFLTLKTMDGRGGKGKKTVGEPRVRNQIL